MAFARNTWNFEVFFRVLAFKNRQMIGRRAGVGRCEFQALSEWDHFAGFPFPKLQMSQGENESATCSGFQVTIPLLFPEAPMGNLWSLQNRLTDNYSSRQQTHTSPHWSFLNQELKALVHNRLKYKHVFLPFIIFLLFKDDICDHILGGSTVDSRWAL